MPKAKITTNPELDPTSAYFEMWKSGSSIIDICREYGKSRNTVMKYLKKNPKFKQPGSGYRATGKKRVITNVRPEETRWVNISVPDALREKLDRLPGKNRTDKVDRAIIEYLKIPVKDRPQAQTKVTVKDRPTRFSLLTKSIKALDRTQKKRDRQSKIIAAIELAIKNNV